MELERLMKLLYYLTQSTGKTTAREMAAYVGVSERTVKNDLIAVREMAEQSGCDLCAQKGKGYWIQVTDTAKFRELEEQLYYRFSHVNYTQEYKDRANRIVRILLVQEDYIKLDDIADRLFLSRSSIKNFMQVARKMLEDFKLSLITKPGYGVKVEGEEINIRFCMLELFIDHDFRNLPDIQDEEYMAYFYLEHVDIEDLRHRFLKILRESETRIVDNNTHRLVRYFFLMYNRFLRGYYLEFSNDNCCFLKTIGEYQTAKDILVSMEEADTHIPVAEEEIFGLELLLLMWSDLNETDDLSIRYPLFYQKSDKVVDLVLKRIQEQWSIDLDELKGIRPILISAIISSYIKIHFDFLGYNKTIGKKVENNMMSSSPLSIALALSAADVIWEEYGLRLNRADLFNYAVRFYICIARIHYDYVPRKILISAQSGNQSCTIIRDKLIKRFGIEPFGKLEIINAYEIRRLNQLEYDYMILNFAPYYYRYDLPVIYVDTIPDERQMNQIYYQVILSGYQLRPLQAQLQFGEDFVFPDFPYENRDSFLHLISYKYCNSANVPKMKDQLKKYTDICVWNQVATIIVDNKFTEKNYFELYCLSTPGIWEKKPIKYILFIAVNFKKEKKVLKYVEQLTHELINNPENMERLVVTKSVNQFYEIVKHGLTLGQ